MKTENSLVLVPRHSSAATAPATFLTNAEKLNKDLRDGSVKTVVATNALELGIDIGGLGAAILVGYPGTIASARQQSGRAGRGDDPALSVMVASPSPLDQFLAHHPEYFFGSSPEMALVNPNHLLILLEHLRCALFELPFQKGEGFGSISDELLDEYLEFLVANQESHFSNDKYYWMKDAYPAANISLRSASPQSYVLASHCGRWTTDHDRYRGRRIRDVDDPPGRDLHARGAAIFCAGT